ncbi:ABC transporter permease [Castellaniella sp.]|uniref:ABC transporter permease n=1 Tax=Castellaniella sp. TaxID=1955812 RepID=UPI002AFE57AE|nr:ABC transporter permease [Castellaniella sp.]
MPNPDNPPDTSRSGPLLIPLNRSWWQRNRRRSLILAARLLVLILFLGIWAALSGRVLDPQFFGSPQGVATMLIQWTVDGTLWRNTWITLQEVVLGFLLGAASGAALAYLIATIKPLWDVLIPYMLALYSVPKVAVAPLFIIWFGIDLGMKVLLAAISVFFLVFLSTAAGVQNVDEGLKNAVRMMGGSRRDVALKVTLPGSVAGLLTGLRMSIPYALIGAVIGELVASNRGLGFLINDASAQFNTSGVFAALVVLAIIAGALNMLVNSVDQWANRWKPIDSDHE